MLSDFPESVKLRDSLYRIKNNADFVSDEADEVFNNIADKLRSLSYQKNIEAEKMIGSLHYCLYELNRQKSLGVSKEKWISYMKKYQVILHELPNPGELSIKTLCFYALRDHGYVLRTGLYPYKFRTPLEYYQMLASWKSFFEKHPDCEAVYHEGFLKFFKNMQSADMLANQKFLVEQDTSTINRRERHQHEIVDLLRKIYKWLKNNSLWNLLSEDYMINTNQILIYESSFRTTPRFLSEFAHMISEDEPWSSMTSADILAYLNEGILAVNASAKEKELTSLDPTLLESDKELSSSLKKYQNHIHSAKILKKICEERYGLCF